MKPRFTSTLPTHLEGPARQRWGPFGPSAWAVAWQPYAGMTREDLGAIFLYFQSVPAIRHVVEKVGGPPIDTQ